MKRYVILCFLLPAMFLSLHAQQLYYKGARVDTLRISAHSGHYHFDSCGTTTGTNESYIIAFNKQNQLYRRCLYRRTDYKTTFKPMTQFEALKVLARDGKADQAGMAGLLKELETGYSKPAFTDLRISEVEFKKLTNRKKLRKIAGYYEADWYFKKYYSSKAQNEAIYKGCQHPDTFNLYLEAAFDTSGYVMVTDMSDSFTIEIITSEGKHYFEGKYPNPYRQPWYEETVFHTIYTSPILNMRINPALLKIVPRKFLNASTLEPQELVDEYLTWYLKRRGIIIR